MCCGYADCKVAQWSPTGKPEAPSGTPVGRNPEQVPPAKAGARVEGSIVNPFLKSSAGAESSRWYFLFGGTDSLLRAARDFC
jgi:hypothetical protein